MEMFIDRFFEAIQRENTRYFLFASTAFVLFYIVFKNKMLHRKIQFKFPKMNDYRRDVFFSVLSITIFAIVAALVFIVLKPYTQIYDNVSDYGTPYFFFSIILMVFIHDTYFYWVHRLMHHPFLYRHVHLIHHKSTNPSPWTAYAFHPLEALFEIAILVILAFMIPAHPAALKLFFLGQIIYNVYLHLGFELLPKKTNKHPIGKWINSSVAHNQHHEKVIGNFGVYFTFWDRMMGTMREDYDTHYEEVTERVEENKEVLGTTDR